ncbi:low specificity L-threonine aldolase [Bosea sp. (in: a-proteobacteria)]|uniref:threonine aldolase family protein n=1 Tax=Bosea sp. (in: a-proteobacteria) TaxID=1871050 RepID=UPI0026182470|nr:GntG family PLP-dependent aldolase [Bosea sp. (in: a-proteobacteria)]MCO5089824.1 beta-eliminating lyase-related protein [Bosea sp. (in: a-proteobacteria)]
MRDDHIDLRSDTVSRPSPAMRAAMAQAPVGDDQYGDDPTVDALQQRMAALLGKETAIFLPSGTMANQIALRVLTRPGDEAIAQRGAHVVWHELGGAAAHSGVRIVEIGDRGEFCEDDIRAAFKPLGHAVYPPTTALWIENTHNRAGGTILPQDDVVAACRVGAQLGIRAVLDGARLFNTHVATGLALSELAGPFDLVSVSLSKGLGCPIGSLLAGSRHEISQARRLRRMFGGGWRQAGILAAAGLYALDHHVARLAQDHETARLIAESLSGSAGIRLELARVQTNIVMLDYAGNPARLPAMVARLAERGVLVSHFGGRQLRLVTHLDVDEAACRRAAAIIAEVICDEFEREPRNA